MQRLARSRHQPQQQTRNDAAGRKQSHEHQPAHRDPREKQIDIHAVLERRQDFISALRVVDAGGKSLPGG